jgi:metal-dependent amidase/aminoacylase/carboxypeptidase family protein
VRPSPHWQGGTPAEEAVGGKVIMAKTGVFAGVDAALGAHPGTSEATCPTVEGSGQSLACVLVKIGFRGHAAHTAADPVNGDTEQRAQRCP